MKLSNIGGIIAVVNKDVAKPFLQVGAIPIIRRIVITYQQVGIFPVVVVVGAEEEEIVRELSPFGVIFLRKQEQVELMDSVRIGLDYLQGKCNRVVFTPVNVPMFTPDTLRTLIRTEGQVVAPSYQGKGGHPLVISDSAIPQILDYQGEGGLRDAITSCNIQREWVSVDDRGVLASVHDQEALMEQLNEHNFSILHPALHMQLEQEEPFFSARLKLLLYLIADTQNMRIACSNSGIAHSKAWDMINRLELNLGYSVVERQRGGKAGGSTKLTQQGTDFLVAYHEFEQTVHQFTQEEFKKRFISTKIIE